MMKNYFILKKIKDSGIFSKEQSIIQYVRELRFRIQQMSGKDTSKWTWDDIVNYLKINDIN